MNVGAKWVKSYGQVRVIVANGVLMRKIIFKSDVFFFFRFKPSLCAKLTSEH